MAKDDNRKKVAKAGEEEGQVGERASPGGRIVYKAVRKNFLTS